MDTDETEFGGETVWEDGLIKFGFREAPNKGPTEDDLTLARFEEQQEKEAADELKDKDLDELDELEDDFDDDIMQEYRAKRLADLKEKAEKNKFGQLMQITEPEFIPAVNNAGAGVWVVVHIFVAGKPACELLNRHLQRLAGKFRHVQFLKIVSSECIKKYPDSSFPMVLLFKEKAMLKKFTGLDEFGGLKATTNSVEWVLASLGVVETELDKDPRKKLAQMKMTQHRAARAGKNWNDSEDDDEDEDEDE